MKYILTYYTTNDKLILIILYPLDILCSIFIFRKTCVINRMKQNNKYEITKKQQNLFIDALTPELAPLRAKIGISQNEIASILGISRQTYSSIEAGSRRMSWNTYLSLIFFFDYHTATHQMIRKIGAFPSELIEIINDGKAIKANETIAGIPDSILEQLDDAAFQAIRTVVMLEYARCAKLSGDAVVKSFDGFQFNTPEHSEKADIALESIKASRADQNE